MFYGDPEGYFNALDDETGEHLWSFQTGSGIHGNPTTYTANGKQYVAIVYGAGGGGIWPLYYCRLAQEARQGRRPDGVRGPGLTAGFVPQLGSHPEVVEFKGGQQCPPLFLAAAYCCRQRFKRLETSNADGSAVEAATNDNKARHQGA